MGNLIFGQKNRAFGCYVFGESGLHNYLIVLAWSYTAAQATTFYFISADSASKPPHAVTQMCSGTLCISVYCWQMACDSDKYEGSTSELGGLTKAGGWEKCKNAQGVESP